MFLNHTTNISTESLNTTDNITASPENLFKSSGNIVLAVLSVVVCVVGVCGNGIAIAALIQSRRGLVTFAFVYCLTLVVSDTALLLTGLLQFTPRITILVSPTTSFSFLTAAFQYLICSDRAFNCVSCLAVTVMSLERCMAILRPRTFHDFVLTKHPVIVAMVIVTCGLCITFPMFAVFKVTLLENGFWTLETHPFLGVNTSNVKYSRFLFEIIVNYTPVTIILVTTGISTRWLYKTRQDTGTSLGRTERKLVTMTILVALSVCLQKAYSMFAAALIIVNKEGQLAWDTQFYTLAYLEFLVGYLAAANDFMVYIFTHDTLRNKIRDYFCCICRR